MIPKFVSIQFLLTLSFLAMGPVAHGRMGGRKEHMALLEGRLKAVGSDTMANLMARWVSKFAEVHPAVVVESEGKGSGAAPAALVQGAAQLAPMSRPMNHEELENFQSSFGYLPLEIKVGLDVLVMYVHKDNPLQSISLMDLGRLYSKRKSPGKKAIKKWEDLGVQKETIASKDIELYGRNSASGTYALFRELVTQGSDFKSGIKEQAGSGAVVEAVGSDPRGIGYTGIGYNAPHLVRPLAIAQGENKVLPTGETAQNGEYPLSRPLVIYVNRHPARKWDPKIKAFLEYVLSEKGQQALAEEGYIGLPPAILEKQKILLSEITSGDHL